MVLQVRRLQWRDEGALRRATEAWREDDDFAFLPAFFSTAGSFKEFLDRLQEYELGQNLPPDRVPDTYLFGFLGGEIIGRISIRHRLNEFLRQVGGHIGYGVLPAYRGRGFATAMLKAALQEAKNLGLTRVLITCDEDNWGSRRVIEKCGGALEGVFETGGQVGSPGPKRRYWIDL